MGTAVSIELADDRPEPSLRGLIDDVCAWLHEVDARFSTFKEDSEVSRMRRGELSATDCSPDLRHVLAAGCTSHYINAGGDIRMRGHHPDGGPWRVGIRHPWQADKLSWVLALTDGAVATSGTYERGGHVVNPRTGTAAEGLCSVTIVGPSLSLADAYATAALAMGEAALSWLAKLATDGYDSAVVTDDGRAFSSANLPAAV